MGAGFRSGPSRSGAGGAPGEEARAVSTPPPARASGGEPRPEHLTRSSFFCIQLYFLLGFSSRGSRRLLSGSAKGLSSTSFSMWLLAASRLSREGRTAAPRSAPADGRQVSPRLGCAPRGPPGAAATPRGPSREEKAAQSNVHSNFESPPRQDGHRQSL